MKDRVWLECQHGSTRNVVFDSPLYELPNPLRWQTGVSFEASDVWRGVPTEGLRFRAGAARPFLVRGIESLCTLALFELFGLFEVQRGKPAVEK